MESGLKDDERMQRVVLQLIAAEDFLEFRNMMLRQHLKMQQEAQGHFGPTMSAEEERLANDAAIAAAIAADASTLEEQQAAAASLAAPAASAAPAAAAPVAPAPAPSAVEERAFGAAGGSYGRAVFAPGKQKPAGSAKAAAIRKALMNGLRPS